MAISGQQLVDYALQFLGTPYVWGGSAPGGFDCSGLMQYVYSHFGISIPRVTYDQIHAGRIVSNVNSAQAGDLIFFDSDHNGTPSHVGMYMGNGQIVVADTTGTPVRIRSLTQEDKIVGITRIGGVISTNSDFGSLDGYLGLSTLNGANGTAAIPAARPTFDWFSAMGLSSGNSNQANQNVGLVKAFIGSDPELANLYSEAVAGSWTQDNFISHLQATDWWKNNSDSVRKNMALKATDPASWNQQVTNARSQVQELAAKLGVPLTSSSLDNVTNLAVLFGYNDAQIQSMLSGYMKDIQQGWFGGYAGQVQLAIREYAMDMGIPVSDKYVNQNTQAIVSGSQSLNAIRATIATQAAAAFPAYADQINKGMTVGEIAKPYASAVSQILEQDPNSVSLYSPILRQALQYTVPKNPNDPNSPKIPAVKQLYDYENDLRSNPIWRTTNNARESMMAAAQQVLGNLGLAGADLGAAPQTAPNALGAMSDKVIQQNTGLAGMTGFSTLQGKEALSNPQTPVTTPAATLAPQTSFTTQGTPQVM